MFFLFLLINDEFKVDILHVCNNVVIARLPHSYNMASIFNISHILLLFNKSKNMNKLANHEKLGKYWL